MTLNMGPQHPSMHGVYRAELDLDGEIIVAVRPEIGNLHRGLEKLCEQRTYHQIIPLTDRLDYLSGFAMNHGFAKRPRSSWAWKSRRGAATSAPSRTNSAGLPTTSCGWACTSWTSARRPSSPSVSATASTCSTSSRCSPGPGSRISFARIGGVGERPADGFDERCRKVIDFLPKRIAEYERIIKYNRIYLKRAKNVGIFTAEDCYAGG